MLNTSKKFSIPMKLLRLLNLDILFTGELFDGNNAVYISSLSTSIFLSNFCMQGA